MAKQFSLSGNKQKKKKEQSHWFLKGRNKSTVFRLLNQQLNLQTLTLSLVKSNILSHVSTDNYIVNGEQTMNHKNG